MKKDVFDELIVVKRSGQRVNFNNYKVAVAIKSAFDSYGKKYDESNINKIYENVLKYIEKNYVARKTINVEDIQDIIETELKNQKYFGVYKEFSEYRKKRAASRQAFKIKQQHKFAIAMEKIIEDNILDKESSLKPNEILYYYGKTVLNEYVKSYIIDNKYLRAFDEGNIYINNISSASLGKMANADLKIESKLENCEYISELASYLQRAQKEINGEIHISCLDVLLSKCVFKYWQKELIRNLKNYINIKGLKNYINLETISKIVNKSEYGDILNNLQNIALNDEVKMVFNLALTDLLNMIKEKVFQDLKYLFNNLNSTNNKYSFSINSSNQAMTPLIIEIILMVLKETNRFENISIIYKFNNINDQYLNWVFQLIKTNKNILIANNKVENSEYFANGIKIYENYNDLKSSQGRLIVSKTDINIARLGMIYQKQPIKKFYEKLTEVLDLVKSELLLMFEIIGNKNKDNYDILFNNNILYDEKLENGGKIRKVIKNSNLLIGIVGLKECVEVLESNEEKQFKLLSDILKFINQKCASYRNETKLNIYIYEPSKELASKYFMALDKAIYGIQKGLTDKEKYDLICNIKYLQKEPTKLAKITKLFSGGNLIIKNIKNTITIEEFKHLLEEIIKNNLGLVKFKRSP